jgi:hypothetical protein
MSGRGLFLVGTRTRRAPMVPFVHVRAGPGWFAGICAAVSNDCQTSDRGERARWRSAASDQADPFR